MIGILYGLVGILNGICSGNVIWFGNYNCNNGRGYRSIGIGISNRNIIRFWY